MSTKISNPVIYTKPDCIQCRATKRQLERGGMVAGRDFTVIDLSVDDAALDYVKSLGHQQAPVVQVGDESWSGFNQDRLHQLLMSRRDTTPA